MFYRGGKLSLEKLCQIENSKQANFSDFQQLAMTLKINSKAKTGTQLLPTHFKSKLPRLKWGFSVVQIKQSEVYEKV